MQNMICRLCKFAYSMGECYSLDEHGPVAGRVLLVGRVSQNLKLVFLS